MIRLITLIFAGLAAAAVFYTFQFKHAVQVLDRKIETTLRETETLREQTRALKAEWTLRESPDRLREFADQYLSLKPVSPAQFTTMADLDAKLPAPVVAALATDPSATTDAPDAAPAAELLEPDNAGTIAASDLPVAPMPVPPMPVPPPVTIAAAPRPGPRPEPRAEPAAPPIRARMQTPPRLDAMPPVRPLAPIQQAQGPPPVLARAPAPFAAPPPRHNGSLLGMARDGMMPVPLPRPMPVSTAPWTNGH